LGRFRSFFTKAKSPEDLILIRFIIDSFGYRPSNLFNFKKALSHKSIAIHNDVLESNERLEFLGDAILDAVIAEYLYEKYPGDDEGYLTKLKSKIVNRKTLSDIAEKMGIRQHLNYSTVRTINISSVEGNAFEALMGAIYLDAGYDQVKKSVRNHVLRKFVEVDQLLEEEIDFKSRLIIWCQKKKLTLSFIIISESNHRGVSNYEMQAIISEKVYGNGNAGNKKEAEQLAAKEALKLIGEID
jgi:ribonuclease III